MSKASPRSIAGSDDRWRPPDTARACDAGPIILDGCYRSFIRVMLAAAAAYFVVFNRQTADVAGV